MGVSTDDIFGGVGVATATPGSYGEAPRGFRLPAGTRLGPVSLQVSHLPRSIEFYERTLGFRAVERDRRYAVLAAHGDDTPVVELRETEGVRPAARRARLGLYHFAILLPDRASLGRFVRHLAETGARAGAADHLVSEALYLQDPDDLGIEVYADRPRETWRRAGRELMIATDPLDLESLVRAAGDEPWRGLPAGTTIGHVHLRVGDIARASAFYSDVLGFDRMTWRYPGALFFGAGGYHHHLGTNTWAGSGARPPEADEPRLLEWTIELPSAEAVEGVAQSLAGAGHPVERGGGDALDVMTRNADGPCVITRDPWETRVRLRVAGTGAG